MSLLDKTNADIVLYPEIVVTSPDGNVQTKASETGIPLRAMIQPVSQSGTSFRRSEQDNEGFESEEMVRLRPPRSWMNTQVIGAQAKVDWDGKTWSVFGKGTRYFSSNRTEHRDYILIRS